MWKRWKILARWRSLVYVAKVKMFVWFSKWLYIIQCIYLMFRDCFFISLFHFGSCVFHLGVHIQGIILISLYMGTQLLLVHPLPPLHCIFITIYPRVSLTVHDAGYHPYVTDLLPYYNYGGIFQGAYITSGEYFKKLLFRPTCIAT